MGLTYKEAGVDITAGEEVVSRIKEEVQTTLIPGVLSEIGGFGGLFAPDFASHEEPVLVASTDGVGTKLKIAFLTDCHTTVGIDLVAMCVNDVLAQGAKPIFFLDYLATGKLDKDKVVEVVSGIASGCREAGCALLGGETAEMPGFYQKDEYDLAGFAVGLVGRKKIISGAEIKPGDKIIGLAASGIHSNGLSLVRKIFLEREKYSLEDRLAGLETTLGKELLKPTRIYVRSVLQLLESFQIKGIAHITGGGLSGNIPRILPKGTEAVLKKESWPVLPIFEAVQNLGRIKEEEMYQTFNMGIGLVLIVSAEESSAVLKKAEEYGEKPYLIGEIRDGKKRVVRYC